MRVVLAVTFAAVLAVLAGHASGQQPLKPEPMKVERVKENLYVIRGPFNACAPNGCVANASTMGCCMKRATWRCA